MKGEMKNGSNKGHKEIPHKVMPMHNEEHRDVSHMPMHKEMGKKK